MKALPLLLLTTLLSLVSLSGVCHGISPEDQKRIDAVIAYRNSDKYLAMKYEKSIRMARVRQLSIQANARLPHVYFGTVRVIYYPRYY